MSDTGRLAREMYELCREHWSIKYDEELAAWEIISTHKRIELRFVARELLKTYQRREDAK